jgi:broad specificity phosphatase PhoE
MKLIIIRHGQTNYNKKDLCNGLPNPRVRLTELGKKQAKIAAKKLATKKIEVIFVSKLLRSRQTAKAINQYHKVPILMDARLNDRLMGVFEGQPASLFYKWRDQQANPWTAKPRGGESYEHMKKRVTSFLNDLQKLNYKNVLIVTHLPIVKIIRGYFKKLDNKNMDKLTEKDIINCKILNFNLTKINKK